MGAVETWLPIPSLPEYEASSFGRIRRKISYGSMPNGGMRKYGGKAWAGAWDKEGNRFVLMFRRKTYRVHRLVCEAFHGPAPEDMDTMHKDEDSTNNFPSNLEWGTRKENLNFPLFRDYASRSCRLKMTGHETKGIVPSRIPF